MVPFPQDGPFRVYCMFFDRFFIVRSAPWICPKALEAEAATPRRAGSASIEWS